MNLHQDKELFQDLTLVCAQYFNIPARAIRKDYFITLVLSELESSHFFNQVVFKGGTSLSKCYPDTIERFSEDIDLTYIPIINESRNRIEKSLKDIESLLCKHMNIELIESERSSTNKSSYVWFDDEYKDDELIKIEIGSQVRPHPFNVMVFKSYIHEYLESTNEFELINQLSLSEVRINVLNIERTFIDKVMAVKRHAICGNLEAKVRHIYDVVKLYNHELIQEFLLDDHKLKEIVVITKRTDSYYLDKRKTPKEYDPSGLYKYSEWKVLLTKDIQDAYERLHLDLLFTDIKQDWVIVDQIFNEIENHFKKIDE
jgi:predicted nucleotidyltransferase component of viral defense system